VSKKYFTFDLLKYVSNSLLIPTVFLLLALYLPQIAHAATCESATGYPNSVKCVNGNVGDCSTGGMNSYPGKTCDQVEGSNLICCYKPSALCTKTAGNSCLADCGSRDEIEQTAANPNICTDGGKCCGAETLPNCESVASYDCRTSSDGCTSPEWSSTHGYTCHSSTLTCCRRNCQGEDRHCCATTDTTCINGGSVQTSYYCSSGSCYSGNTETHTCNQVGGSCRMPNDCTAGTIDTLAVGCESASAPICCVGAFSPTCTGSGMTCVDRNQNCPSDFPDQNASKSCDEADTKKCCVSRQGCNPAGCPVSGGHATCQTCGSNGCPGDKRCSFMGGSSYACVGPCAGDTGACNGGVTGQCGTEGGCPEGQQCVNGDHGADPICVASPMCTGMVEAPYTGPIISIGEFIGRVYALLYPIGILLGVLFIGKAGYTLMTSEGNPNKVKEGQDELTAAVLGTLFIMGGFAALRILIKALLGGTF
jgi:hypothetical protein